MPRSDPILSCSERRGRLVWQMYRARLGQNLPFQPCCRLARERPPLSLKISSTAAVVEAYAVPAEFTVAAAVASDGLIASRTITPDFPYV
jgi:hypothetical protein